MISVGRCFACDVKCIRKHSVLESIGRSQHRKHPY